MKKGEFNQFQSNDRSFLSKAGAALIFFASFLASKQEMKSGLGEAPIL